MVKDYIEFPGLGWKFNLSPVLVEFEAFGIQFSIKWYGLIIAIGFLAAMIYALKRVKHFKLDPDRMIDVVLVSALFAFVGARLYYVLFSGQLSEYIHQPAEIFKVWKGGLAIYGGIIFAFITALWMCRLRKVNTLAMFDIASLGFLIGQAIGRWGNFFNQEAFGGNTDLPWRMTGSIIKAGQSGTNFYDPSLPVHPTFLYESLWCLLGFIVLHIVSKRAYKFKGEIFALYIMWYGAGRAFIEGLRTDSLFMGTIRISQMVAILSVIGGLILFFIFRNYARSLPKDLFDEPVPADGEDVSGKDEPAEEGAGEAPEEYDEEADGNGVTGDHSQLAGADDGAVSQDEEAPVQERGSEDGPKDRDENQDKE